MTNRSGRRRVRGDDGRAIIEVVFAAVLLLIPVVYILVGVLRVQAASMAVAQAARDVGRLIETSPQLPTVELAEQVARVALVDQGVLGRPADGATGGAADGATGGAAAGDTLRLRTTTVGGDCLQSDTATLSRQPGIDYDVCVIAVITLPGVPSILTGSDNTVTGVYTIHIDELREGR